MSSGLPTSKGFKPVLPDDVSLQRARDNLTEDLPMIGVGLERMQQQLQDYIIPALNQSSNSPNYYGLVTGGVTPAAALADNIVTAYDQNVSLHLPKETIATEVEDRALKLLCRLVRLDPEDWPHRTFTTGATASNVIGLACGRELIVSKKGASIGQEGLTESMHRCGLRSIQVLSTMPHSSISKAGSIVGIGRANVKTVSLEGEQRHKFDFEKLEQYLKEPGVASIVTVSCAEVNTGFFATNLEDMIRIRKLCNRYGAWLHVDGAFGLMGRLLEGEEYIKICEGCEGMDLADSITGDGHKLLNVPYDCGFFFSRHRGLAVDVFQNPSAAYFGDIPSDPNTIATPLHIGIENSRRFRALPVYATLLAYGRAGYRGMLERQVRLARAVAEFIFKHPHYVLLPDRGNTSAEEYLENIYIIVLFRAKEDQTNQDLVLRINGTSKVYASGTVWDGAPACRFAISNWQVDVDRDLQLIKEVLDEVAQ